MRINDNHKLSGLSFTRDLEIIITEGGASSANSMNLSKNFLSLICFHLHLPVINLTLQAKEVRKLKSILHSMYHLYYVNFNLGWQKCLKSEIDYINIEEEFEFTLLRNHLQQMIAKSSFQLLHDSTQT